MANQSTDRRFRGLHMLFGGLKVGINHSAHGGKVSTTDATATTIFGYTPKDGKAVSIVAQVTGRKSDGTQAASYGIVGTFRRSGNTVTQVGATQTAFTSQADDGSWGGASFVVNGSVIQVTVTGKAATSIDWGCKFDVVLAP